MPSTVGTLGSGGGAGQGWAPGVATRCFVTHCLTRSLFLSYSPALHYSAPTSHHPARPPLPAPQPIYLTTHRLSRCCFCVPPPQATNYCFVASHRIAPHRTAPAPPSSLSSFSFPSPTALGAVLFWGARYTTCGPSSLSSLRAKSPLCCTTCSTAPSYHLCQLEERASHWEAANRPFSRYLRG